jgi:hypothetical protein
MSGRQKKRACLIGLVMISLLLAIAAAGGRKWVLDHRGDRLSTLSFVDREDAVEEKLIPYYDAEKGICYLFLPSYSNQKNITIYFEGAKTAVFQTEETFMELERGASIQNLETDTLYTLGFSGGEDEGDVSVGFRILQSASLPTMFIETESGTMDNVDADKANEESGRYALVAADGQVLVMDKLKHITGRGNETWQFNKKSYGIRLKSAADLLDMGSADHWVLLSNVCDTTCLRNKITYDMAIAAGMTGAPDSRYVDLYINNEYHGMYLLCEKIEVGENRIPMADLGYENERLNKGIELLERVVTDFSKSVRLGTNPKDISGGYLLERDVASKYDEEVSGFQTTVLGNRYTIKNPEYASVEETAYIENLVNGMERAAVSEDGIDPETGKSLSDYIDIKSFAQKYIIEELCKNNGGGASSSWFYKPQDSVSTKLFAGPVWDYDKGYAIREGFDCSTDDLCYMTQRAQGTTLFWYLSRHQEFRDAVKECYAEFFSDYIEKVTEEKIPEYMSQISASAEMDAIRWEADYKRLGGNSGGVSLIKDFLTGRKAFLDRVWLQDAELATVHFVAAESERDTYMSVIKGECLQAAPPVRQEYQNGGSDIWYTADGVEFDITQPVCEDVTVYAGSSGFSEN